MDIKLAPRGSPDWKNAINLVLSKYKRTFDAEATPDPDYFLVCLKQSTPDAEPGVVACAGMSFGIEKPFFSEHYLDEPIQQLLSRMESAPVARESIMEVGSLASVERNAGTELIRFLPLTGVCLGKRYGLFTLTQQMRALFDYIGLPFFPLRASEGERLGPEALQKWGRYYENAPVTAFVRVDQVQHLIVETMSRYRFSSREDEARSTVGKGVTA